MKQKKNSFYADFVSIKAIEVLVTKKIEKNFSLTKWSHIKTFDAQSYGYDYFNVASRYLDLLAKTYPDMYFMSKAISIIKCR